MAIEMRSIDIMAQIMSYLFYLKHGEKIAKEVFLRKPPQELIQKLYALEEEYNMFNDVVDITSEYKHPTGIFKYLEGKSLKSGVVDTSDPFKKVYKNTSGVHQISLIDTINSMKVEGNHTKTTNIDLYSGTYSKQLVDYYGHTSVIIQQADKGSESNDYNFKGNRIEYKTMPSRGNLAYSKHTGDDANIVMSLYSPFAYSIMKYPFEGTSYDITKWRNNFRVLNISKNRDGEAPGECCMYFDGKISEFLPLQRPSIFHRNPELIDQYILS